MSIKTLLTSRRMDIINIAARHGAHNVRLFGSVARGEDDERSDVDFLVNMDQGRSLMDHAGLVVDLENLLGRTVDVAPENVLRPGIRERVLKEAVAL